MRMVPRRAGPGGRPAFAQQEGCGGERPPGAERPWPPSTGLARRVPGAGTAAAVLLASACSWYPKEMGDRLEQRVDRMETASAARQPEESSAAAQELARRLDLRISGLQKQIEALSASAATSQQGGTERTARLESLAEETRRLRTVLEQHTQRLDAMERSLAQQRPAARERTVRAEARPAPPPAPPPAPQEQDVLAIGREQEARGEKAVARSLYEEFLEKYPKDPGAAEARYRLGELAYGEKRYRDAIVQYGRVAEDYPGSERAPEALVQTAESMLAIDLRDDAVTLLNEVPKRYPGTPAAGRARQRLAELGKPGQARGRR